MNTTFSVDLDNNKELINRDEWKIIYKKMADKLLKEK